MFHVKHKLDSCYYAIKKVELSAKRVQKIQEKGQAELDNLLEELRTLARLDHPNIVRYYGGWLEYSASTRNTNYTSIEKRTRRQLLDGPDPSFSVVSSSSGSESEEARDQDGIVLGKDLISFQAIGHADTIDEAHMSPEHSVELPRFEDSEDHVDVSAAEMQDLSQVEPVDPLPKCIVPSPKRRNMNLSLLSETDEMVVKPLELTSSRLSVSNDIVPAAGAAPTYSMLTLHIQMSLHPLTLADFLSPDALGWSTTGTPKFEHCFHPIVSLRILLAILDGVEHLHSEGVVHRDLKPANILLTAQETPTRSHNCIDLSACKSCAGQARKMHIDVRIGDLGLVTSIARPDVALPVMTPTKPAGTEFYCPPGRHEAPTEKLDIFALGVIAFELLWKFSTCKFPLILSDIADSDSEHQ